MIYDVIYSYCFDWKVGVFQQIVGCKGLLYP